MSAPRLTRRLVLEARSRVPDGRGGFGESWSALGELWAEVDLRSGREVAAPPGPQALTAYRITVRGAPVGAPSRPVAGQRFREGTRVFAIRAVAEADALGRYLTCFADEEVSP